MPFTDSEQPSVPVRPDTDSIASVPKLSEIMILDDLATAGAPRDYDSQNREPTLRADIDDGFRTDDPDPRRDYPHDTSLHEADLLKLDSRLSSHTAHGEHPTTRRRSGSVDRTSALITVIHHGLSYLEATRSNHVYLCL